MKSPKYLLSVFILILWLGCNSQSPNQLNSGKKDTEKFSISEFNALDNYGRETDTLSSINIDFTNAMGGIEIPTRNQTKSAYFIFSFKIKNNTTKSASFYYKLFYQNETYKFEETRDTTFGYLQYQEENFYGSWSDTLIGYKSTVSIPTDNEYHIVTDSFKIVGNPRFEERYYDKGINNKWQRNPRVGNYEFLLSVADEKTYKEDLPSFIQHVYEKENGHYINPFDYLQYRLSKKQNNLAAIFSPRKLKVVADLNIKNGIFIDSATFKSENNNKYYCETCGPTEQLNTSACFKQFKPFVIESTYFDNIPLIADVNKEDYNITDYYWHKNFIPLEERIHTIPMSPRTACESVSINKANNSLVIKNPASKEYDWRKEIAGVITRHGLTYGKFTVKCKMTRLLNNQNMWNGITNAIWLLSQSDKKWNYRRVCKNGGYIPEYMAEEGSSKIPQTAYSEIDIEVMKAEPYCPSNSFPPFFKQTRSDKNKVRSWLPLLSDDLKSNEDKIHVTCTNWDMGCKDASRYAAGCVPNKYGGSTYESFRWGLEGSRGVTGGQMENDKELYGSDYYYFEIDWKPNEIIWRVGPELNNMHVVCYMDSSFTNIPNNQMLLIIDQEFHNTKWWYGAPFEQWNVPFPKTPIEGIIYEVIVE